MIKNLLGVGGSVVGGLVVGGLAVGGLVVGCFSSITIVYSVV